jgi:DNA-binding transcriptional MerR regulator
VRKDLNMKTVKEVKELSGVSVRTLHYYDEIGLLTPRKSDHSGYRLYDEKDIERLQQILFFRELGFELKKIKEILDKPDFNKDEALKNHKDLLSLKRTRLDNLIKLTENLLKGENKMSFKEFDMAEIENAQKKYKKETEERWGNTDAYKESQKKTSSYTKEDWAKITAEDSDIYNDFVKNMDKAPASKEVQELVARKQAHITKYFYTCTKEILAGLGEMYVADERFTKNIDKFGTGLAEFISKAIKEYCKNE